MVFNASLITTIIPTYRRPKELKKAVESVLAQTYPHFQVCIYDNASGDETKEIIAALSQRDPRVHYHCHSENIGAAENFQYGLSKINTPYFSFLSDDDFLLPTFYETTLKGFKRYPEAAISSGAVLDVDERGEWIDVILMSWPEQEYYLPPKGLMQMVGNYSNWVGTLFCTEKVKPIGSIDHTLKAIDVDYLFRIAAQCPMVVSKQLCAAFVHHSSSYSGLNPLKLVIPGWSRIAAKLNQLEHLSLEEKTTVNAVLHADVQRILFSIGIKQIKMKKFDAVKTVVKALDPKEKKKRSLLEFLSKGCQSSRLVFRILHYLLKVRRKRKVNRCIAAISEQDVAFCFRFFSEE